jgi:tellurite resistance protein TerA
MQELTQGGNASVPGTETIVAVEWSPSSVGGSDVDVSAFLLATNGKVRDDNDFVFYGSKSSGCGSVRLQSGAGTTRFSVDLARVPPAIEKIAFTATLSGARWGQAQSLRLSLPGVAGYTMVTAGKQEAAVIVGELYKRNGAWKVRAVGQGFNGGLGPLATSFGVDITDDPTPAAVPASQPPPPRAPVASASAPASPRVSLSKITLDKTGSSARLSLAKGIRQEIVVNLNWSRPKGIFSSDVDLDLGVFVQLRDGSKFLLDGLQFSNGRGGPRNRQTRQGCFDLEPFVWHAGDDRSGGVAEGENVFINTAGLSKIRRMTVYCFIFEGSPSWSSTNAVVTIKVPGQEIEVQMGSQTDDRPFCGIASIEVSDSGDLDVTKTVTFHRDHEDCDRTYGWGFRYTAGTK